MHTTWDAFGRPTFYVVANYGTVTNRAASEKMLLILFFDAKTIAMPKKISPESNEKLQFTLPKGARELLDQLVETQELGGSHAEVIRYLVETQLQIMRKDGTISRKASSV